MTQSKKSSSKRQRDNKGRFVKGSAPNPTGKGGFKEHPENSAGGYWKAEDSISFQYKKMLRMSSHQFEYWRQSHPKKTRTVAQEIAYQAVKAARNILNREQLQYLKEVTDRTEGKAPQSIDMTSKGERFGLFDDEQIKKIARRVARGRRGTGDTSGEKKSH